MKNQNKLSLVRRIAHETGWSEKFHKEESYMVRFVKGKNIIDVWYSKMTVCTIIDHPVKGRGQMFRKGMHSESDLLTIFSNPRTHTGKGYYGGSEYLTKKQEEKNKKTSLFTVEFEKEEVKEKDLDRGNLLFYLILGTMCFSGGLVLGLIINL